MSPTRLLAIGGFVLATALFVLVEWRARRPDSKIPTWADLTGFVMQYEVGRLPLGRIAMLGFWWWIGWHFFAR
jgi:hypothetical protein